MRKITGYDNGTVVIREDVGLGLAVYECFGTYAEFVEHVGERMRRFTEMGEALCQELEFMVKMFQHEREKGVAVLSPEVRQFIEELNI